MPLSLMQAFAQRSHSFASLPETALHEVLGVTYAHVHTNEGDDLFLTERGWPWVKELQPENWYRNGNYKKLGTRLRFSTGAVYRVPLVRQLQIVVKFSRLGQYLDAERLLTAQASDPNDDPSFLSPFEEIGVLEQLRKSPERPRMLTKRALGVFSPRDRYDAWQLGRIPHHFERHARKVVEGQTKRHSIPGIVLDPNRSYVTLFQWMKGQNLEECVEQQLLDRAAVESINRMVIEDLHRRGFKVLDHKPDHVVVKFTRGGSLLTRHGRAVYGLADFELLTRLDASTIQAGPPDEALAQPSRAPHAEHLESSGAGRVVLD